MADNKPNLRAALIEAYDNYRKQKREESFDEILEITRALEKLYFPEEEEEKPQEQTAPEIQKEKPTEAQDKNVPEQQKEKEAQPAPVPPPADQPVPAIKEKLPTPTQQPTPTPVVSPPFTFGFDFGVPPTTPTAQKNQKNTFGSPIPIKLVPTWECSREGCGWKGEAPENIPSPGGNPNRCPKCKTFAKRND